MEELPAVTNDSRVEYGAEVSLSVVGSSYCRYDQAGPIVCGGLDSLGLQVWCMIHGA